ncbi:hypothetical protein B0T14DRAFT_490163 [Immersiella caudata]|uniref:Uncharacterized protein n=1 Tax=Immersiella caudata TaxID=314043 RepID=A0AA39XCZ1_9PEZI|nr:hypothetical protein B0T14DRAFT_490163 [Immersiella caudata]
MRFFTPINGYRLLAPAPVAAPAVVRPPAAAFLLAAAPPSPAAPPPDAASILSPVPYTGANYDLAVQAVSRLPASQAPAPGGPPHPSKREYSEAELAAAYALVSMCGAAAPAPSPSPSPSPSAPPPPPFSPYAGPRPKRARPLPAALPPRSSPTTSSSASLLAPAPAGVKKANAASKPVASEKNSARRRAKWEREVARIAEIAEKGLPQEKPCQNCRDRMDQMSLPDRRPTETDKYLPCKKLAGLKSCALCKAMKEKCRPDED